MEYFGGLSVTHTGCVSHQYSLVDHRKKYLIEVLSNAPRFNNLHDIFEGVIGGPPVSCFYPKKEVRLQHSYITIVYENCSSHSNAYCCGLCGAYSKILFFFEGLQVLDLPNPWKHVPNCIYILFFSRLRRANPMVD